MELSNIEKEMNWETCKHIFRVQELMSKQIIDLHIRLLDHDKSKLESPEVEYFAEYTPKLKNVEYGSDEYKKFLEELKPALDHHYACNDHHPEFHERGIDDMNLVDLIEMLCDWKASSERTKNGDIYKSLEYQKTRFGISDQLLRVLRNTVDSYM